MSDFYDFLKFVLVYVKSDQKGIFEYVPQKKYSDYV